MDNPNKEVMELVTDVLKGYQKIGGNSSLIMGYIDPNEDVEVFAYLNCNYSELRRLAIAIHDEATLRMIAVNQDRIEKFKAQNEVDNAE